MESLIKEMGELGIIPVVKINDPADAVPLGKALIKGGLPVAEITFRTSAAQAAITLLAKKVPEILIGAGTVLTVDQAKQAVAAGARFIVSPGFNPKVVDYCCSNNIPVFPGINNPTTLEAALDKGLDVLKFFPAEASGGVAFLKAMSAPYGNVRFIPTGGINPNNLTFYLSQSFILACGGSWMVKPDIIAARQFDYIEGLARQAIAIMLGFSFAGYMSPEKSTGESSTTFLRLAGNTLDPVQDREIVTPTLAFSTYSLERAKAYFRRQEIAVTDTTVNQITNQPMPGGNSVQSKAAIEVIFPNQPEKYLLFKA